MSIPVFTRTRKKNNSVCIYLCVCVYREKTNGFYTLEVPICWWQYCFHHQGDKPPLKHRLLSITHLRRWSSSYVWFVDLELDDGTVEVLDVLPTFRRSIV